MSMLNRKLLRELWMAKGQNMAIVTVVASGVAVFVMALGVLSFLQATRDAYYDRYRFGDLFASLVRAPVSVAESIRDIEGVAQVQTRIVSDVTLSVPGLDEPAVGRLISLPSSGVPELNRIHLLRGRFPDPLMSDEVLAAEAFVDANSLQLLDRVSAVINGRYQELRIVGVVLSPEYVFQIRAGEILPDERRFGVLWMQHQALESALDMDGAFNDLSLKMLRGSRPQEIVDRVDAVLERYGGVGAILREDQISAKFLNEEIKQLRSTALVAPMIFLSVAAFLLNIVLSRKVSGDRQQIAALRAFGYSTPEVAWHYLKSSMIVAALGAGIGVIAGTYMGTGLARLYSEFYRFPDFVYQPDIRVIVPAVALSFLAACLGAYRAVASIVRLQPADAMRPPAPAKYTRSLVERLGLGFLLPLTGRMIIRQLGRRPVSSLLAVLGIAASVSVMVLSSFAPDALDYLLRFQFELAQRYDVQVALKDKRSAAAVFELQQLPGVQAVEPFRVVPVDLVAGHRKYRTSISGIGQRRDLLQLLNTRELPIQVPPGGLVLSDALASLLHVKSGDWVIARVHEGEKPELHLRVNGIATELVGTNAYMDKQTLHQHLRESDIINGAYLSVDQREVDRLYRELKRTPFVAAVAVKQATVDSFRDTVSKNTLQMQSFTTFFAAVIAIGVVYNTARISLDERSRELATMRVIGFSRMEVSMLLLGELAVLTITAIPLGWLLGYGFCWAMVEAFKSEMFRIPLIVLPSSYAKAAMVTIAAATVSGLVVRRMLDDLDLVEVLKDRG